MIVQRKDLKVGIKYYMDARRTDAGVFIGREDDTIFFDCGPKSSYMHSLRKGKEGLVCFNDEGDGFEQVLLGDDLTQENLELINSFENN